MNNEFVMRSIGTIHTAFVQASGTPVQSCFSGGAEGTVELLPEFAPGLKHLEGFDRIWLLYLLDRVSEPQLVARPYLDDTEHGVFATRVPARPNRIGMSSVRLLEVNRACLRVADVDILDGTPLLDLKPCVPEFDFFPVGRIGWYASRAELRAAADDRFESPAATESRLSHDRDTGEEKVASRT